MNDGDFAKRLAVAPQPREVVRQLFSKARSKSEERFFCAIIDLETITVKGKSNLFCEVTRSSVIQQFADYFSRVAVSMQDFSDTEDATYVRRLHMLAYSQFWECLGIQRLLNHLVDVAGGGEYHPKLFLDNPPDSYTMFKNLRDKAKSTNKLLSAFLTAIYSNQIRNAFAHSQFWFVDPFVRFENYNSSKEYSIQFLKLETWDDLFLITSDFIIEFFNARRNAESDLKVMAPYRVDLPEFSSPFAFSKDDRGWWTAKPSN